MRSAEAEFLQRESSSGEQRKVARLGQAVGLFLGLPELRAFWPFSSVNESGNAYDLSGQGRTLTNNGTITRGANNSGSPYAALSGSNYWSRATEAGLAITGAMTVGGWVQVTTLATDQAFISKWTTAGNQCAHVLYVTTGGAAQFGITSNGATLISTVGTAGQVTTGAWYFLVGRFTPSTSISSWCNGVKATNTTSIPATIFNSTAALIIGGQNAGAAMTGYNSMSFLCAAALTDAVIAELYAATRGLFGR